MGTPDGSMIGAVTALLFSLVLALRLLLPRVSKWVDGALFASSVILFFLLCQALVTRLPAAAPPANSIEVMQTRPAR